MEVLFGYLIKFALYTSIFYGVYRFFLSSETFYRFNRFFLLLGLMGSLVLPLITFNYEVTLPVAYTDGKVGTAANEIASTSWVLLGMQLFFYAYFIVGCLLLLRQFFGLWKLKKLANNYGYVNYQGCKLITSDQLESSFSVVNYVFLATPSVTSVEEKSLILEHELAHVKQYHWVDLSLLQLVCVLQWFNPIVWLYSKAVKANHEFLADQAVLASGNSPARYRATLVNQSLKVPVFVFSSPFLGNSRVDRLKMMRKANSSPVKQWSVLLVLPLILLVLLAFAEPEYTIVESKQSQASNQSKTKVEVIGYQSAILESKNKTEPVKVKGKLSHPLTKIAGVGKTNSALKVSGKNRQELVKENAEPMLLVNGVETNGSIKELNSADIEAINVYKDDQAMIKFGDRGRNGVIEVMLKKVQTTIAGVQR